MTNRMKWFVLIVMAVAVTFGSWLGKVAAQLQQSGGPGSSVAVTNFPATQNVSVQNASLAVTGTFWQATQPVSGTVSTVPKTACGTTVASQALSAVPTTSTAVFASTTCVMNIVLNNTNGTAATVTVTDNSGTPVNDVLTFSIPGNSQLIQPLWGVAFTSGLKWSASGTGITGAVIGYQ